MIKVNRLPADATLKFHAAKEWLAIKYVGVELANSASQ
jgi:hypothetical protein